VCAAFYVSLLPLPGAAAKKNDDRLTILAKVHPVTGAEVEAQLEYSCA
jgi:hypothetical protein